MRSTDLRTRRRRPPLGPALQPLLLLALLWPSVGPALAGTAELDRDVQAVLARSKLRREDVGVHVVDARSGSVLYARNADRAYRAASNAKLATAASALDRLGLDYEFETVLIADGTIEDGVLRGDLVFRGSGDPTIGGRYDDEDAETVFRRWAKVLRARGIRSVSGTVVVDDRFFDREPRHPDWARYDAWKWYYTTVGAASINDNCVTIRVTPGAAVGAPAALQFIPAAAPLRPLDICKTSSKTHSIWFDRKAGSDIVKVGGYCKAGTKGYEGLVSVPDPARYTAAVLRSVLVDEGIAVRGRARVVEEGEPRPAADAEVLCTRRVALAPVLRTMLRRSHNHYAEQVFKTLGAEECGVGSAESGAEAVTGTLRSLGFADGTFNIADGSGLSREDKLPPALITALLTRSAAGRDQEFFASLLAVPGEDGTLHARLTEEPYRSAVRAKTGYIDGTGALSGYAQTRTGRRVAFSILVNDDHSPGRTGTMGSVVDGICRAIVDHCD
jgi:D-alanyl-D-alanine carboxypeptidase/D-alanyl-D-alanine-endopeptidase (penicillin-binding protein 4)